MNLRSLDLNLLLVFDAVYRDKSVTKAAERLNITQSAVSNALRRLRDHLDDPLFEREGMQIAPTAEARRLFPTVRQAMQALETAIGDNEFDPATSDRTFTIILPDPMEMSVIAPLLEILGREAPGIKLVLEPLVATQYRNEIVEKNADMVLFIQALFDDTVNSTFLYADKTLIIVREDHPVYGARDSLTLEDMQEAGFVGLPEETRRFINLEHQTRAVGASRRIVCMVKRFWSIPHIVSKTYLMGVIPQALAHLAEPLKLKLFEPPLPVPDQQLYMSWHRDFDSDPAHLWLRNQISDLFASSEGEQTSPPNS